MKIEKINENQLRFTLTREDLSSRQIKLSELAYGSEKAKSLFRDMMQQAAEDFGFEANNAPLMIEAIPVSSDSIVLIVTKVDDPDELDSRFARFSTEKKEPGKGASSSAGKASTADDILDLISKLEAARKAIKGSSDKKSDSDKNEDKAAGKVPFEFDDASASDKKNNHTADPKSADAQKSKASTAEDITSLQLNRFFLFHDLQTVIRAAKMVSEQYLDHNSLFKNPDDGNYYLILSISETEPKIFNSVCNILSEYAEQIDYVGGMEQFFTEHMSVILDDQALQDLKKL